MDKLKSKVGIWVTGESFFNRAAEVQKLVRLLDEGNSVLLVAPRRVGKTSLVRETFRRMDEGGQTWQLYVDLEHCTYPHEFLPEMIKASRSLDSVWRRLAAPFMEILDRVEKVGVPDTIEISMRDGSAGGWQRKGEEVLQALVKLDKPICICLDELPVMVSRMLAAPGREYEESRQEADVFLSWLRKAALLAPDRLRFVICGSIGLEPIAARHKLSHTIAHLAPFHLAPWTRPTAEACARALAENYGLVWEQESLDCFLEHVRPWIPHHVQMFFSHIHDLCESNQEKSPSCKDVDMVYERHMLGTRGHAELATYEERLVRVLGGAEQRGMVSLALDLLTEAAMAEVLLDETAAELAAASSPPIPSDGLQEVLNILEHDGYLERSESSGGWVFNVPLLRDWWKRRFSLSYQANPRKR